MSVRRGARAAAGLLLFLLGAGCAGDTTDPNGNGSAVAVLTLQPDPASGQDVWITSTYSYGDDYGVDDQKLQVGGWADLYYALLRFDVQQLPKGAASATIILQPFARTEIAPTDVSTPVSMALYQVTSGWDENTGWFGQPTATFVTNLPVPVVGQPYSIDVSDLYNKWKAGSTPNFGIELRPAANDNRFNVFRSSDYLANPSLRPMLRVVTSSSSSADHFTWPIDPTNPSNGTFATCGDNPSHKCFWLSPSGWRDAQPFLQDRYVDDAGKVYGYHLGADWNLGSDPADAGLPVYAVADGVVISVQPNVNGWGNVIFVRHVTSFGTYTSMYAHVDWLPSGPPQLGTVVRGQQIAVVGNAGGLYGYPYHLHLEIRNGSGTDVGLGYVPSPSTVPPQGQVDPDAFIAAHR